jgi:hypothetical protein
LSSFILALDLQFWQKFMSCSYYYWASLSSFCYKMRFRLWELVRHEKSISKTTYSKSIPTFFPQSCSWYFLHIHAYQYTDISIGIIELFDNQNLSLKIIQEQRLTLGMLFCWCSFRLFLLKYLLIDEKLSNLLNSKNWNQAILEFSQTTEG